MHECITPNSFIGWKTRICVNARFHFYAAQIVLDCVLQVLKKQIVVIFDSALALRLFWTH